MELMIHYNVKRKESRELAQAVSEVLNTIPVYKQGVQSCYEISRSVLERQGTLLLGDSIDSEMVNRLLSCLAEQ